MIPLGAISFILLIIGVAASGQAEALAAGAAPTAALFFNPFIIIALLVFLAGSIVISALVGAANTYMAQSYLNGKPMGVWASLKLGMDKIFPLSVNIALFSVAWALAFIVIGIVFFLLIAMAKSNMFLLIPIILLGLATGAAVYFSMLYIIFFTQATVLKDKFLDAFSYSFNLVKNRFWATLGYFLVILLIAMAAAFALWVCSTLIMLVLSFLLKSAPSILALLTILVQIIFIPLNFVPAVIVTLFINALFLNRDAALTNDSAPAQPIPAPPAAPQNTPEI